MKLTALLVLIACLQSQGRGFAQSITLTLKNTPLEKVFKEVRKQTGYTFIYTREQLERTLNVDLDVKSASLQHVLDECFRAQPITYTVEGRFVVVKPRPSPSMPPSADTSAPRAPGGIKAIGRVMGNDMEPLSGASVRIRRAGDSRFTTITTDEKGYFRLTNIENGNYAVEVTFIGYEKIFREIRVSDVPSTLFITLKRSVNVLDEVQTTAYSKTSMRFNTGDITTIKGEEIARNPVPNVLEALQGRVPGMFVSQTSGQVGGAFRVQVRSLNTLSGGAASSPNVIPLGGQPLYIIDGVEYPASSALPMLNFAGTNFQFYGNALNYFDPSLIESINILKGADATAVYGSRGAFGVILITTKKATAGKSSLSVNARYGFSELGRSPTLMNTQQYLAVRRNALANDHTVPGAADYDLNGTWDTTQNNNWQKIFMGDHAPNFNINATYSGGSINSSFLIGANYKTYSNIQMHKGMSRSGGMNFSLNTNTSDRKFGLVLSGSYSTDLNNMVPVDFTNTLSLAPNQPYPFLPNGKLDWTWSNNPAAPLNALYNNTTDNLVANT
ncbi:MAG: TonB-dependent receptor plug domain-containing protein, partial [Bacteroidetes bacterium]|nr:TonB-dependent receptor plug domain-containing protein [Bacteroidota bacterium]